MGSMKKYSAIRDDKGDGDVIKLMITMMMMMMMSTMVILINDDDR